jgi:hypothetical protein
VGAIYTGSAAPSANVLNSAMDLVAPRIFGVNIKPYLFALK